jgi:hypothetical protein
MRPNCEEMRRDRSQVGLCLLLDTPKSSEVISTVWPTGLLCSAACLSNNGRSALENDTIGGGGAHMYIGRCHIGNRASHTNDSHIETESNRRANIMHTNTLGEQSSIYYLCVSLLLFEKGARRVLIARRVFCQDIKQSAGGVIREQTRRSLSKFAANLRDLYHSTYSQSDFAACFKMIETLVGVILCNTSHKISNPGH